MDGERTNGRERRRYPRVSLLLDVRWESLSGRHSARTTDVSLGGCYIESIGQVTVGEQIRFEIQLPTGRWMPLRGEVLYHHPNLGFGVRFIGLTEEEETLLARMIRDTRAGERPSS